MKHHPDVDTYIARQEGWQIEACTQLRSLVAGTLPEAEERLQYGKPHYLKNGHYAAVIQASKGKVTFTIFNASGLKELKGYFAATTDPNRKTATLRQGEAIDYKQLAHFLATAAAGL